MKRLTLAFLLVALFGVSRVDARPRVFIGGGPTGTSNHGFRGGWGGSLGLESQIAPACALLLRLDGGTVPSTPDFFYAVPLALGESGPGSSDATLLSARAGLRLRGPEAVGAYLDALVGLGYLNDPFETEPVLPYVFSTQTRRPSHANVSVSVGPGIEVRATRSIAVFADVHYDFFFVEKADTPVIPLRFGLIVR